MATITIPHRFRDAVIFEKELPPEAAGMSDGQRLGLAVLLAVKDKCSLTHADLRGAVLRGAVLSGAVLRGAAGIIYVCVPPPCGYNWHAVLRDGTIWVAAGCRWQTIDDREAQVRAEQTGVALAVRLAAIAYIRAQAVALGWMVA